MNIKQIFKNWRDSSTSRRSLDAMLTAPPSAESSIRKRLDWLSDIIQWLKVSGSLKTDLDFKSGSPQAARLRYLVQVLERNPAWKTQVQKVLSSIIKDTKALDLFINTGVPQQESFWSEFARRLNQKILPQIHNDSDLAYFFATNFHDMEDTYWLSQLDTETFIKITDLFEDEAHSLKKDAYDAIVLLAIQIEGLGFNKSIRTRIQVDHFSKIAFYKLVKQTQSVLEETDSEKQLVLCYNLERSIDQCFLTLRQVYDHLDEHGVSVTIIYQLERLEAWLKRLQILLHLVVKHADDPVMLQQFFRSLVEDNINQRSIAALFSEGFSLLSRKIAERSAETGEHYITRDWREFLSGFKASLGGGALTGVTTFLKFAITSWHFTPFITGALQTVNYSVSFLGIHFMGLTLATKQPAMTAPALAAKMHRVHDQQKLNELTTEIVHLIRSQASAVLGNVISVIPAVSLICVVSIFMSGNLLLTPEKAEQTLNDFSFLGSTPLYAAFTGILLWFSSLFSGWSDNWFVVHQLETAIGQNRKFRFIVGEKGARKFAKFLRHHFAPIVGNVSLAFFLGILPAILQFLAIPLDVRHVTLSTGSLTAAMWTMYAQYGITAFFSNALILAILGILSMAILNVGTAFTMAFLVAVRARRIMAPERTMIYESLWKRFKGNPLSFFIPSRE